MLFGFILVGGFIVIKEPTIYQIAGLIFVTVCAKYVHSTIPIKPEA
jgi:hypothetical protein